MNLPNSAIEFLDAYRGLYRELYAQHGEEAKEAVKQVGLPIVHCYCFTKDIEGAEKDICEVRFLVLGEKIREGTDRNPTT